MMPVFVAKAHAARPIFDFDRRSTSVVSIITCNASKKAAETVNGRRQE